MPEQFFQGAMDYAVPLLRMIAGFPEGVSSRLQFDLFWQQYQHRIPALHLEGLPGSPTRPRWRTYVSWTRSALKTGEYIESSSSGYWQITAQGREWLAANPGVERIKGVRGSSRSPNHSRQRKPRSSKPPVATSGISLDMLERTRQIMPADQFRQIWGDIYEQLCTEERGKAVTQISDKELLLAVRQPVRRIQDFLQGRGNDTPKSEEVCDWIQFCYTLGLYREGAALWQYVQRDEVNASLYERSKKIAAVCRTRIGT